MEAPLGVFDSGVGGLTVMRQLIRTLPHEAIVYFGDTARLPYGEKSRETIIRFSQENAAFLQSHGVKALVVACHTASALALDALQATLDIPVVGLVTAGVHEALLRTRTGRVGILGTRGTIGSGVHTQALLQLNPEVEVTAVACPLFVPLVEERLQEHAATHLIAREYLQKLIDQNVDTVILGCTHYPLLRAVIQQGLGDDVTLVDPAEACARELKTLLGAQGLLARSGPKPHRYFVSDDPVKFQLLGQDILGEPISEVGVTV